MFIKNADPRHPPRHHELFLPSRPYRGEPPTVAGFLLYPDTPAMMETTTQEAFCFRPLQRQAGGKGDPIGVKTQQEIQRSRPTSCRQTEGGNSSREDRKAGDDEREGSHHHRGATAAGGHNGKAEATEMQSQYQTDFFPPPSSCCRRRTPAQPQPDNIGINHAFRIEFSTVQRGTYPGMAHHESLTHW